MRIITARDWDKAYKAISFEREAYSGREKRFGGGLNYYEIKNELAE